MMRRILQLGVFAVTCIALAGSCGRSPAPSTVARTLVPGQPPPMQGEEDPDRSSARQSDRPGGRIPESTVYVDGSPVAILRAMELPPGLQTHLIKNKWGADPYYLVTDYLASIKVDVKSVRAVHLYGGSRAVIVDGDDLRKNGHELGFAFTLGDRGKVSLNIPGALHVNTTIDLMTNLAIYVDKEPPTIHRDGWGEYLALGDGKRIEGIPYAEGEQLKGTRIYIDGMLVSTVKRRLLPNSALVGEVGESRAFSLVRYLDSVDKGDGAAGGIARGEMSVKAVDMLSDDDLVERIEGGAWDAEKNGVTFTLPAHSRGQVAIGFARLDNAKARISSIQIFVKSSPPKRWLALRDVVALAAPAQPPSP